MRLTEQQLRFQIRVALLEASMDELTPTERILIALLTKRPMDVNELARVVQLSPRQTQSTLYDLEQQGMIQQQRWGRGGAAGRTAFKITPAGKSAVLSRR